MMLNHGGVSGGKDSTALMLWMVHESGYPRASLLFTFCDTGNEDDATYQHIAMLSETVHPITILKPERDFYKLAKYKKRFPSAKARFCTQELKMKPTKMFIEALQGVGRTIIAHSGVRAAESADRAKLPQRSWDHWLDCETYRPLLAWSTEDVWAIHARYGIPRNPLYDKGAARVGCFPCIMSRKTEIRNIALNFPQRFDRIREAENDFQPDPAGLEECATGYSSFFGPNIVPQRFRSQEVGTKDGRKVKVATIDDVIKWAMTGYRAIGSIEDQMELDLDGGALVCHSGYCE